MLHSFPSSLLFLLGFFGLNVAQTVAPFPTHDCSNQIVYTGSTACDNVLTACCGAPGVCCAGGCCPFDAICVFEGTADEACCPISDSTACGAAAPPSTTPKTCPEPFAANIPCSGVDSSWYCDAGCTCAVNIDGGCNCLANSGCIPSGSSSSSTLPDTPTSSSVEPEPAASSSSESDVESQTTSSDAESTTTSDSVVTTTSSSGVVTSTVTSDGAAAATTTSPGNGAERLNAWESLGNMVGPLVAIIALA
ncbi:hypothetical protein BKA64DRAFT_641309 [Cadophora sp. MPI-SDFR-AT-0126]|nr:hypothetical protein BKA64DRAFT_641309 [Leotiomycetes sp. MPI-SDFR-AT-0126]